jgi:probable phosphoglycerate mutase
MHKLIIVRHGQTANNAARLLQGQLDIPLADAGVRQAEALAKALSAEPIDLIISSPLMRALKTAQIVNAGRDISLTTHADLRERCFGSLQGQAIAFYQEALAASGQSRLEYQPPGGESIPDMAARCARAWAEIRISDAHTVLVSAHEGINKCLILMLLGKPLADWLSIKQENCCINTFDFDAQQNVVDYAINRCDHLSALAG